MFKFSSIIVGLGHLFAGAFSSLIPAAKRELTDVEQSVVKFVSTDVGKLALDGVQYASTLPYGTSGDAARAAAKTKFVADLKTADHDAEAIGTGVLDWMIQTAYTYADIVSKKVASGALTPAPGASKPADPPPATT